MEQAFSAPDFWDEGKWTGMRLSDEDGRPRALDAVNELHGE